MNEINKNKKYTDSKKNLSEENIDLKIENEVLKKQLLSIRDMINRMIGSDEKSETELIAEHMRNYYKNVDKVLENAKTINPFPDKKKKKEIFKEPHKCVNCQDLGMWDNSFCPKCKDKDHKAEKHEKPTENPITVNPANGKKNVLDELRKKQDKGAKLPSDYQKSAEELEQKKADETDNYKCSKCGIDGDDEASFKKHNGVLYCLDCLTEMFRG